MANGIFFQWDAGHHAVVVLLFFGAALVSPIGLVRVLKLYWHGATIVLPRCACYLAIEAQIFTANTAAQESQLWDSRQPPWFKMVLNRDCAVQKSEAAKL